jgi:predicted SnoaL-like aldol condensation-catalyzing enzyme
MSAVAFSASWAYVPAMRRTFRTICIVCALAVPILAIGGNTAAAPPMSPNAAAAVGLLEMAFNEKKVAAAFDRYVGATYTQHNPIAPDGRAQAIAILSGFVEKGYIHYDIKRVIADGNLVAVHSHVMFSAESRGSAVVDIFRFENGKIVEHWDVAQPVPEKSANSNTMF